MNIYKLQDLKLIPNVIVGDFSIRSSIENMKNDINVISSEEKYTSIVASACDESLYYWHGKLSETLTKEADSILDKGFADTACAKDLDRIVSQFGINRKKPTKSIGYVTVTGLNGSKIFAGEKAACDTVSFTFLENKTI